MISDISFGGKSGWRELSLQLEIRKMMTDAINSRSTVYRQRNATMDWLSVYPCLALQLFLYLSSTLSHLKLVKCQDWLIDDILPEDYDSMQAPLEESSALFQINGTIQLRGFHADKGQRSLHTDLILCMEWRDYRIQNYQVNNSNAIETIRIDQISRFWTPKAYFRNALSSDRVNTLQSNEFIIVMPRRQKIKLCSRLNVQFVCIFNLSNFPFDAQTCYFELENTENLQNIQIDLQFVTLPPDNYQFKLHHVWNGSCIPNSLDKVAQTRRASCAFVAMRIVRHISYYIIRYYLTTLLIMMICFVQFWIPTIAWPGRLVFTVVVTLILMAVSHTAYDEVPVPDVSSLIWWIWSLQFIQFFVYMALVEFAVALAWVQFAQDKQRARASNTESPDGYYFGKKQWYGSCGRGITALLHKLVGPIDFLSDEHGRNKIDYCARFLFPSCAIIFIFTYVVSTVPSWAIVYR